jgi:hypothetical protein
MTMDRLIEVYDLEAGKRCCVTGSQKIAGEFVAAIGKRMRPAALFDPGRRALAHDQRTAVAPVLELTADVDGIALWTRPDEIIIYPDFESASAAHRAGKEALAMLASCLATAPGREDA